MSNRVYKSAGFAVSGLLSVAWAPMAQAQAQIAEMPSPVTAVTARDACGIACEGGDLAELANYTPLLMVAVNANDGQIDARIGGIGTVGSNAGLDSSVGLFVDGVYRSRLVLDLDLTAHGTRVEVLRGPQGVRFGRNAVAGVINVVTPRARGETRFSARAGAGNHGTWQLGASAETGLGSTGAIRLGGNWRRRDGFTGMRLGGGPRTQQRDGDSDHYALRGQLNFALSSDFTATLDADLSRTEGDCCAGVTLVRGPTAAIIDALAPDEGIAPAADPFARQAWGNRSTAQEINDRGISLRLEWDNDWLGGATVRSTTALRDWDVTAGSDIDHTSADLAFRPADESGDFTGITSFSQVLEVSGGRGALAWLFGATWSRETLDRNESTWIDAAYEPFLSIALLTQINPILGASPTAPLFLSQASGRPFGTVFAGQASADRYEQRYTSLGLYTDNTWQISDRLSLDFGFRYTFDDKRLASTYSNPNGTLGCTNMLSNPAQVVAALVARGLTVAQASAAAPQVVSFGCRSITNGRHDGRSTVQTLDDGGWAGSLAVRLKVGEDNELYLLAARGYKAGGFNLDRVQSNTGLSSGTSGIVPVNDTSFGAETAENYEAGWQAGWNNGAIKFKAAVFHQRHSNFQVQAIGTLGNFIRSVPKVTTTGFLADLAVRSGGFRLNAGVVYADARYGDDLLIGTELINLPGSRLNLAPEWSFTGALGYDVPLAGNLQLRADLGMKYVSQYNTNAQLSPLSVQGGYAIVDARLAVGPSDGVWSVAVWGRNLTDTNYIRASFDAPFQNGTIDGWLGAPRTFGATLRLKY